MVTPHPLAASALAPQPQKAEFSRFLGNLLSLITQFLEFSRSLAWGSVQGPSPDGTVSGLRLDFSPWEKSGLCFVFSW